MKAECDLEPKTIYSRAQGIRISAAKIEEEWLNVI
jgi:hypothetical protein